jgi:ABC-type nickel/cobalt efflux system permease component RcnA
MSPTAQVVLLGHYGPYLDFTNTYGQQGRIEKIFFADATFTNSTGLSSVMAASVEATSGKQAELADAADRLAEEARGLLAEMPKPGSLADRGRGGRDVGPEPGGEPAKHHRADKKHKHATKATHEKKHATKGARATKGTEATRSRAQRP